MSLFSKVIVFSLAGGLMALAALIAVGAISPTTFTASQPLIAIATPEPRPTPDPSLVTVTHDSVLMQCFKPDDCGLNMFTVPSGSLVKVLNKQTGYVRVVDVNRTSTCNDAEHEQKYAVRPTAPLCVNRNIEGVMPLT